MRKGKRNLFEGDAVVMIQDKSARAASPPHPTDRNRGKRASRSTVARQAGDKETAVRACNTDACPLPAPARIGREEGKAQAVIVHRVVVPPAPLPSLPRKSSRSSHQCAVGRREEEVEGLGLRSRRLLELRPQLRGGAGGGAVGEVEDCAVSAGCRGYKGPRSRGSGNIHSSTQSSLAPSSVSAAAVTRSTQSSKWCLGPAHCLDSAHSAYRQHVFPAGRSSGASLHRSQ